MALPLQELYRKAAAKISEATFMVIAAGAGFSADSGLAVYKDIANVAAWRKRNLTYPQLCSPEWLPNEPETFFGFHGTCLNNYRDTTPHAGYGILLRWANTYFNSNLAKLDTDSEKLKNQTYAFVYTSNVDSHFEKAGFPRHRIHAIHGEQEYWQCLNGDCSFPVVRPPLHFRFRVNPESMLAMKGEANTASATPSSPPATASTVGDAAKPPSSSVPADSKSEADVAAAAFATNHPRCQVCKSYLRPNILMFSDMDWKSNRESMVWFEWRQTVSRLCKDNPSHKVVILELGCGKNVPSIKIGAQSFAEGLPGQACVIRINPYEPDLHGFDATDIIRIQSRAIDALPKIDDLIVRKQQGILP